MSKRQVNLIFAAAAVLSTIGLGYAGLVRYSSSEAQSPSQDYIDRVSPITSTFQREMLLDGRVTFEEHERAIAATIGCVQSRGLVVQIDPSVGTTPTTFTVSAEPEDGSLSEIRALIEDCQDEFMSDVNFFFATTNFDRAAADRRDGNIRDCMVEKGLPNGDTAFDVLRAAGADLQAGSIYLACELRVDGK